MKNGRWKFFVGQRVMAKEHSSTNETFYKLGERYREIFQIVEVNERHVK